MNTQSNKMATIILIIWRYTLNLNKLKKPPNIRLIVVGPSNMVVDESWLVLVLFFLLIKLNLNFLI